MQLASAAFDDQHGIPSRHTCEGADVSPPLEWSGLPAGTRTLALIVDDPDAPDPEAPEMTWVHWVAFNIPPDAKGLEAGASGALPEGAREGINDSRKLGYSGPCPPVGEHRYFHKLYALDTELDLQRPTKDELLQAMEGHVLDHAELVGTYEKGR